MFTEMFYRLRFDYSKWGKIYSLLNHINNIFANTFIRTEYRFSKIPTEQTVANDVVVSLTTYPPRMQEAIVCISSLLRQSVRPYKLILWLAYEDYPGIDSIPNDLKKMRDYGLDIRFCDNKKSYKKIYEVAKEYPGYRIVTADDDFIYPEKWLEELIYTSDKYNNNIICHRSHRIIFDDDGKLIEYGKWDWYSNGYCGPSHALHVLTGAGTLFPKWFFEEDFFDWDTIQALAPTTDDFWVKVYALRKGVKVRKTKPVSKSLITIIGSQKKSLISINQSDGNDRAFHELLKRYNIDIRDMIESEGNEGIL